MPASNYHTSTKTPFDRGFLPGQSVHPANMSAFGPKISLEIYGFWVEKKRLKKHRVLGTQTTRIKQVNTDQ